MEIGLLWYDTADPKTAIVNAATRYRERFGVVPNACYVHPDTAAPEAVGVVQIKPLKTILPHHYWIGMEQRS